MKTHRPTTQRKRHRPADETHAPAEAHEAVMSSSVALLRDTGAPQALRAVVIARAQRAVGNAAVEGALAQRMGGQLPEAMPSAKTQRTRRRHADEVVCTSGAQSDAGEHASLQRSDAAVTAPSLKHTFKSPPLQVPIEKSVGPITIESLSLSASLTYKLESEAKDQAEHAGPSSKIGTSYKHGDGVGMQYEVEQAWKESALKRASGFTPQIKGGGEITPKGGELAIEGSLEGDAVSVGLKLTLAGVDPEHGLEFLTLAPSVTFPAKGTSLKLKNGATIECEMAETVELKVKPNYVMAALWLRQQFAAAATAEVAITTGFIANGAFALTGLIISLADADDLARIPDEVNKYINDYCDGYNAAMRQLPPVGDGQGYQKGYEIGQETIKKALERVPANVLVEEASKHNYKNEAYDQIAMKAKLDAIQQWKDSHWFDTHIGNGYGRRMLAMALGLSADAGRE
jgi:hypothetical protein